MALSIEDIQYLDTKFNILHGRISKLEGELEAATNKTCYRLTQLETKYEGHIEQKMHDYNKKWQYISAFMGVGLGILGFIEGINIFG